MQQLVAGQTQSPFQELVKQVRETFVLNTEQSPLMGETKPLLFRLNVTGARLLELLTLHLSDEEKQNHNCSTCRDFLKYWGNVGSISKDGKFVSAIWPDTLTGAADIYQPALDKIWSELSKAQVKGPVLNTVPAVRSADRSFLGGFEHLNLEGLYPRIFGLSCANKAYTDEEMYKHFTKFKTLRDNYLGYYRHAIHGEPSIKVGIDLLKHHKPARWSPMVAQLETHLNFQEKIDKAFSEGGQTQRDRVLHLLSATHDYISRLNNSVLGEMLDALLSNRGGEEAIRRFNLYTDSSVYMRPTRELTDTDTQRANEIVSELGLEPSLRRREATLEDIEDNLLWRRSEPKSKTDAGFFDHLREEKKEEVMSMGEARVSMSTFMSDSIRGAERVVIHQAAGAIGGLLTAVSLEDKPIITWDNESARNPVSWYVFNRAPDCCPLEVEAICDLPCQWSGNTKFTGHIFAGKDVAFSKGSVRSGLFPEILRNELHTVRATVEKYSANTPPQESDNPVRGVFIFDQPGQGGKVVLKAEVFRENRCWNYLVYLD